MSNKQVYQQRIEAQKVALKAQIDELKIKANKVEATGRNQYADALEALDKKQQQAEEKLNALSEAGEDTWENIKDQAEQAYANLSDSISEAAGRFK